MMMLPPIRYHLTKSFCMDPEEDRNQSPEGHGNASASWHRHGMHLSFVWHIDELKAYGHPGKDGDQGNRDKNRKK